jgi:hypothetical protein
MIILKSIRKRLKVFSILSSLAILVPTQTNVSACSYGSETEELRYMLFNPDLLNDKSWWTFFYNAKLHYLDGSVVSLDDETILTREWIREMKVTADESEARDCLFGGLSDSLLQINSFYQKIQANPSFKKYFGLAKKCEKFSSGRLPWEEEKERAERAEMKDGLIADLEQAMNAESNLYLKKKYAFQLVRAGFYASDHKVFTSAYDKYFKNVTERSVLDWWALHYKSVFDTPADSANYLHALIFNHASAKRYISRLHFSSEKLDETLALAQNDEQRADVYVLANAINPGRGLDYLQKVYALAPDHPQLPLIVGREINKLEDWLGTTKIANAHIATDLWQEQPLMENWQRDYVYLQEVITALEGMTAFGEKYPDFYNLSMACLQLMKGDAGAGAHYLDKVRSAQPEIVYQQQVLKIIQITEQKDIRDAAVQEEIGELFTTLIKNRELKFESQKILYSLSSYLRYSFANKGMVHLAGLFDNFAVNEFCYTCSFSTLEYSMIRYFDQYASVNDLARLIEVYDRPVKNKLEEILLLPYSNKNYFYDLLAVKYLRQGDLKNSSAVLNKIPDDFWLTFTNASYYLDDDPFLNNQELLGVKTIVSYNRREIIEKMLQLEAEAASSRDKRALNYFQLGNAWFNFTQHSWFMLSYGMGGRTPDERVFDIGREKAMAYYKKAMAGEMDKEMRAKTAYMIALLADEKDQQSLARLYESYSDTNFHRQRNCLSLQDIASGNF